MTEQNMISLLNQRDETVLSIITAKYGHRMHSVAKRILHSQEEAEECVNDCLFSIWTHIPPDCPSSLEGYIIKTVTFCAYNRLRRMDAQKRSALTVPLDELSEELASMQNVEQAAEENELRSFLSDLLEQLNEKDRFLFVQHFFLGQSPVVLSLQSGLSISAVRKRLSRMKHKFIVSIKETNSL